MPLTLCRASAIGYLLTWPHVQPWHYFRVRPMLRGLADGDGRRQGADAGALARPEAVPARRAVTRPARETSCSARRVPQRRPTA